MRQFLQTTLTLTICAGLLLGDWKGISNIGQGHKIRVETSTKKYKGAFLTISDTALKLNFKDGEVSVPRAEVLRVYSQSQSHRLRNTIIGAAIGTAIGIALYFTLGALIRNESGEETAPYLIGPIAAGAALGAVLPTGKMVKIYDAKSDLTP